MSSKTSIEWTDASWNPIRGCTRVSEGCRNCYAEKMAARFSGPGLPFEGFAERTVLHGLGKTHPNARGTRWTGRVELVPGALVEPLSWRKPQRVFVNSMSDLFHEALPDEAIDRVFAVMLLAPRHTFQILTKRPARMVEYFKGRDLYERVLRWANVVRSERPKDELGRIGVSNPADAAFRPWIWLGVSVEDQKTADERIPLLLQTPAAVRFVSYEPALGPVDFGDYIFAPMRCGACGSMAIRYDTNPKGLPTIDSPVHATVEGRPVPQAPGACMLGAPLTGEPGAERCVKCDSLAVVHLPALDWLIVGGESGAGARPFDVAWARSVVAQCKASGVAAFIKQLGSRPYICQGDGACRIDSHGCRQRYGFCALTMSVRDPKGGNPEEWPADLRVREFPSGRTA